MREAKNSFLRTDSDLWSFLDGSMLGDGHIQVRSKISGRYTINQKHKTYCDWIKNFLGYYGIEPSGKIYLRDGEDATWKYTTLDYGEFKSQAERWYQSPKRIPNNVRVNPISLRHWFSEDGGLARKEWGTREVYICANDFPLDDVEWFSNKLAEKIERPPEEIHVYDNRGPLIRFGEPKSVDAFFDFLAPIPKQFLDDYYYKFPQQGVGSIAI